METAEIHSMSMEFFTEKWMNLFFGNRAQDYVEMHLEDAAAFIPYGCMVDEFQHIVYEHPELTPAERKQAWSRLEREYKPHLDYEEILSSDREASGRSSCTFTTTLCIISIIVWHRPAHYSTR